VRRDHPGGAREPGAERIRLTSPGDPAWHAAASAWYGFEASAGQRRLRPSASAFSTARTSNTGTNKARSAAAVAV